VEKLAAEARAALLRRKHPSRNFEERGQPTAKACEVRFGNSCQQTLSSFEGRDHATILNPTRLKEWRSHFCDCASATHSLRGKEAELSSRTIRERLAAAGLHPAPGLSTGAGPRSHPLIS
jgi:hypothetical protein